MIRRPPRSPLFPDSTLSRSSFTESSPLNPSSPYSATKAGADLLVASYRHTFGLEALVCRGSNNYGPDRKSTRLNSSHANISYAVFCLQKKETQHVKNPVSPI